jgi:AraC family transcriptional regulator
MYEWQKQIQIMVDEIDTCIINYKDEALTLRLLSQKLGYSTYRVLWRAFAG